jgi:hypothetical protein
VEGRRQTPDWKDLVFLLKPLMKGLMSLGKNEPERLRKRKTRNMGFRWMRLAITPFQ